MNIYFIIDCNYKDLARPCFDNNIEKNTCETQENPNDYVTNIIDNCAGCPFTSKGYTYDLLSDTENKYGVTEVILPQGNDIKITVVDRVTAEDYFCNYLK